LSVLYEETQQHVQTVVHRTEGGMTGLEGRLSRLAEAQQYQQVQQQDRMHQLQLRVQAAQRSISELRKELDDARRSQEEA
jgi:predicted  nucleic acid-binding Zn-ribbon protein